jgi:hypothetical protein
MLCLRRAILERPALGLAQTEVINPNRRHPMPIRVFVLALAALAATALAPAGAFAQATSSSPGHAHKHHPSIFVRVNGAHPLNPQPLPPRKTPKSWTAQ